VLCQMAISELREETGDETLQFIAVRLPYGVQAHSSDCRMRFAFIQPDRVLTVILKARAGKRAGVCGSGH
jgi:NAD+ synthase